MRTHGPKYCFGKTPVQTFLDSLQRAKVPFQWTAHLHYLLEEPCSGEASAFRSKTESQNDWAGAAPRKLMRSKQPV
jgi:hypothetical protein